VAQAHWAVLGATGQIGQSLLEGIAAAGETALALARQVPAAAPTRSAIQWLRGDLFGAMPEVSASCLISAGPLDGLVHWLAQPDAGLTCARLIAFSSTSVVSKAQSTDPAERDLVQRLARAEAELAHWCDARKVPLLLLRPTMIYGRGLDRNLTRLAGVARRFGFLPLPLSANGLRQPVHADDLAALALGAARREPFRAGCYELAGDALPYREMAARVMACLPSRPRLLLLPDALFGALNACVRAFSPGAGLNAAARARLALDLVCDDRAARADLAWAPRPFQPEPAMFEPAA
jgi:nucleoside-diphosphate-sugar epimerase